jgi:hypothetical protein
LGVWGAIIMNFFGAVFAALTLALTFQLNGPVWALPFLVFVVIALAAVTVMRRRGQGFTLEKRGERTVMWSSIGEGIGLFVAANVVTNLGHPELLLPAMALVVGLHFLPIAYGVPFPFLYALGAALLAAAAAGFVFVLPLGSQVAGLTAATALWLAAILAVIRDTRRKANKSRSRPVSPDVEISTK